MHACTHEKLLSAPLSHSLTQRQHKGIAIERALWTGPTSLLGEVCSSLQEVEWAQPPRPPQEFLGRFSVPRTQQKLQTRLKCNCYYYRTNYLLVLLLCLLIAFIRSPWAFLAVLTLAVGGLCLNNTFAVGLSNSTVKLVRRVHPPTAQKLRAISGGHSGLGAPGRTQMEVKIVGVPRGLFVALLQCLGLFLLFRRGALLTLACAVLIGGAVVLAHAAFKVPNLKTRLASAREEFRAVWRGYQEAHDYSL